MTSRRSVLRSGAAVAFGASAFGALISADPAEAQIPPQSRSSDAHRGDRFEARQCAEIVGVLKSYERSLNASDVAGVVQLYTGDAVLLAPGAPSGASPDRGWAAQGHIPALRSLSDDFEITALSTGRRGSAGRQQGSSVCLWRSTIIRTSSTAPSWTSSRSP